MLRMSLYGTNKNCNLFHLVFFFPNERLQLVYDIYY